MPYMKDFKGERLDDFEPGRDLPRVILNLDASTLTGADGAALPTWPDLSGGGRDVKAYTNAAPTMATIGGKRAVHFGTGAGLIRREFGSGLGEPNLYAQPNTYICVVRAASAVTAQRALMGSTSTTNRNSLLLFLDSQVPYLYAGSGLQGGRGLNDDQFHVIVAVFGATSCAVYVDGWLWTCLTTQAGTEAIGQIAVGCTASATQVAANTVENADYRQVIVCNQELSPRQILAATEALTEKWETGQTLPQGQGVASYQTATDSAGIAIRVWLPSEVKTSGNTLVIWSHHHSGSELISPANYSYPYAHTSVNEGWIFAASNMHGDQWGNATAQTDLLNLYNYVNTRWPVSKVILMGSSMGGLATANAISHDTVPNVVGAVTHDGVLSLSSIYANASYTASIKTAYGIAGDGSDYAARTDGWDPILASASLFTDIPWRFYGGDGDVTVPPASHMDPFAVHVAAAPEKATLRHSRTHLSTDGVWSDDFAAFVHRCID